MKRNMPQYPPPPSLLEPVCIIEQPNNKTGKFPVNYDFLDKLLLEPSGLKEKKICVVSIAGAFRGGKSFLLNFLLAYMRWLQAGAAEGTGVDDWLDWAFAHGQIQQREQQQSGGDARASGGFRWSGGRRRVTVGIQVWPEAFLVGKNDDTVVLLVDSQGLFDSHTNMQGNTVIFVLSSLLSSVQILNIKDQLNSRELEMLALFTGYASLVGQREGGGGGGESNKIIQELLFLVRDWASSSTVAFGEKGGDAYLASVFQELSTAGNDMASMANSIGSACERITCWLMPPPGEAVRMGSFMGQRNEVAAEFLAQVRDFVPALLAPDRLTCKTGGDGKPMTVRDWMFYLQASVSVFLSNKDMTPESILQATALSEHLVALSNAGRLYQAAMEQCCDRENALTDEELGCNHERLLKAAKDEYTRTKKLPLGRAEEEQARCEMLDDIKRMFNGYREQNGLKRLLVEATMAAREAQLAADRAEEKWRVERKAMLKAQRQREEEERRLERDRRDRADELRKAREEEDRWLADLRVRERTHKQLAEKAAAESQLAAERRQRAAAQMEEMRRHQVDADRELERKRRSRSSSSCTLL